MILNIFTLIHVVISLLGILTGLVMVAGWLGGRNDTNWTRWFLVTTTLTTLTGFLFPFHGFTPALGTGIVSLAVLALAIYANYACKLRGGWRKVYVISAALGLYLNVFVLIVQSFQKIPVLKEIAPTQKEMPFILAQLATLLGFMVFSFLAVKRFPGELKSSSHSNPHYKTSATSILPL